MTLSRLAPILFFLLGSSLSVAQSPASKDAPKGTSAPSSNKPSKLPISGLAPSKIIPNLCVLTYPVSTTSAECQQFVNQGLGYYYSYVWMEAARSFETATQHDPQCALAWWQLSRALEKWGRGSQATKALLKANELKDRASFPEQQLILARMQEKGQAPNVGEGENRKQAAIKTIDELLTIHDEDEEAWYYRAHLAGGQGFGGVSGAVPFYKALLRINPLHPGANHELVHYYENSRRPALGWKYAEGYIQSSPGIPHPFHMQAHLATRIGRWDKTSDRSSRAIELQKKYHQDMDVKPSQDQQYSHHLEILTLSLIHDGRFAEARAIQQESRKAGIKHTLPWFRLHVAEGDWSAAQALLDEFKRDKLKVSYLRAVLALRQGDLARATSEVEVLRQAYQTKKNDRKLELDLWETQGLLLCHTGAGDAGCKLLERAVKKTIDDYSHHAWGNGAYYMEQWGVGALKAGKMAIAEEAFLEALAHDHGSVRAALGLQVLCERQGRTGEAQRYAELARKFWSRARVEHLEAERAMLRNLLPVDTRTTSLPTVKTPSGGQ